MKSKLSKISLALLVGAGMFILPNCSSDNKPNGNAATSAEGEKMATQANKSEDAVSRGRYLVTICLCNDCHSPKIFTPQGPVIDSSRMLSGSPADGKLPKLNPKDIRPDNWVMGSPDFTAWVGMFGISYTANLTPDPETGLGSWTPDMFRNAIRSGKHMGVETGRPIMPPMPWDLLRQMTDDDMNAVFAYLHSLKPIVNKVPANKSLEELSKM